MLQSIILRKMIIAGALIGSAWFGLSLYDKKEKVPKKQSKAKLPSEEKIKNSDTKLIKKVKREAQYLAPADLAPEEDKSKENEVKEDAPKENGANLNEV